MDYLPIKELELFIIRHGQSMGNAGYGRDNLTLKEATDPYLTEKGLNQAGAAGKYLSGTNFDAIYSSGLLRAVQTANEIINAQSSPKTLYIQPLLTEMGVPEEYNGAGMDEICRICPSAELAYGINPEDTLVRHNAGSDEEGLFQRAKEMINYLRKKYQNGEKVAIVNHAAFMTFLVFHIMGFDKTPVFDIDFENTNITKVTFYKPGTNKYGDIVFEYINNTAHLDLHM